MGCNNHNGSYKKLLIARPFSWIFLPLFCSLLIFLNLPLLLIMYSLSLKSYLSSYCRKLTCGSKASFNTGPLFLSNISSARWALLCDISLVNLAKMINPLTNLLISPIYWLIYHIFVFWYLAVMNIYLFFYKLFPENTFFNNFFTFFLLWGRG